MTVVTISALWLAYQLMVRDQLLSYRVPTAREGGIWGTSGPSIDANGNIYVSVGNGERAVEPGIIVTPFCASHPHSNLKMVSAPDRLGGQNGGDQDLGSMGPVLLPNNQVFIDGKAGKGYLLNGNKLGGVGGQLQEQDLCNAFGGQPQWVKSSSCPVQMGSSN